MASFADLKQKRMGGQGAAQPAKAHAAESAAEVRSSATQTGREAHYDGLDGALLEIRDTKNAGRTLYAKRSFEAGSILMRVKPHLAILDKAHMSILCSHCMLDKPEMQEPLKRCSACKVTYYCSTVSRDAFFLVALHNPSHLKNAEMWISLSGLSAGELDSGQAQVRVPKTTRLGQASSSCWETS